MNRPKASAEPIVSQSETKDVSAGSPRYRLEERTSPELAGDKSDGPGSAPSLLIVPLGATEQHGPHLPLGTDTTVATHWAALVAEQLGKSGQSVTVAPALPYGSSGEHQMFPGTLSIGQDALVLVLVELTRSASKTFDRVIFLSGHAGNAQPVSAATERLAAEGHDVVHFFPSWPDSDVPPDAHAGRTETSLMLHLEPQLVRCELAEPGDTRPLGEVLQTLVADGVKAVSTNGILGDPSGANAEEGQRLMTDLVERTVSAIRDRGAES